MKGDVISDGQFLYRYVNPASIPPGQTEVPFGFFDDRQLSCDWAAHQPLPELSFHITEGRNLIVRITVCDDIRNPCNPKRPKVNPPEWKQEIYHDPIEIGEDPFHPTIANHSHSLISGLKKAPIQKAIAENSILYKTVTREEVEELSRKHRVEKPKKIDFFSAFLLALFIIALIFLIIKLL